MAEYQFGRDQELDGTEPLAFVPDSLQSDPNHDASQTSGSAFRIDTDSLPRREYSQAPPAADPEVLAPPFIDSAGVRRQLVLGPDGLAYAQPAKASSVGGFFSINESGLADVRIQGLPHQAAHVADKFAGIIRDLHAPVTSPQQQQVSPPDHLGVPRYAQAGQQSHTQDFQPRMPNSDDRQTSERPIFDYDDQPRKRSRRQRKHNTTPSVATDRYEPEQETSRETVMAGADDKTTARKVASWAAWILIPMYLGDTVANNAVPLITHFTHSIPMVGSFSKAQPWDISINPLHNVIR